MSRRGDSTLFVRYGNDQAPFINVHGDRIQSNSKQSNPSASMLDQDRMLPLQPIQDFIVATDCSCVRSLLSGPASITRTGCLKSTLADRFRPTDNEISDEYDDEDDYKGRENSRNKDSGQESDDEESLHLSDLFKTLKKFSSRVLNPLQARSISRLACGYRGKEKLTKEYALRFTDFFDTDSPPIQDAALIALFKLVRREDNLEYLFSQYSGVLESVLSLASDAPTLEVQISALKVIHQITQHTSFAIRWERQLEDIVYPLVHAIVKNKESVESQRMICLHILRALSQLPVFAARVKQDVLSRLDAANDSPKIKSLYLEILYINLQLSKQRISTDIVDNVLLPVLRSMLIHGPCNTQKQALNVLFCVAEDGLNRTSLLADVCTISYSLLCTKHSKCRKVRSASIQLIAKLIDTNKVKDARMFLESITEALQVDGSASVANILSNQPERATSALRKKSRAEALLWRNFDEFLLIILGLLEKEGCINTGDSKTSELRSDLNVIGKLNSDQVTCVSVVIGCLTSLCSWPMSRPRKSNGSLEGAEEFIGLESLRDYVVGVNHHHVVDIWNKGGRLAMAVFRWLMKRISSSVLHAGSLRNSNSTRHSEMLNTKITSCGLTSILHKDEAKLLTALIEFAFVMSLGSCSFATSGCPLSARSSSTDSLEKRMKAELSEKERSSDRRLLRKGLVDEGIFYLIGCLMKIDDSYLKMMTSAILRLCLQPINEKALAVKLRKSSEYVPRMNKTPSRPQSAMPSVGRHVKKTINQTLFHMGKPGIGQRPQSSIPYCTPMTKAIEGTNIGRELNFSRSSGADYHRFTPLTARSEKKPIFHKSGSVANEGSKTCRASPSGAIENRGAVTRRPQSAAARSVSFSSFSVTGSGSNWSNEDMDILQTPLSPSNNLGHQCCERALAASRDVTMRGIFSPVLEVKKSSLLFLHDLVQNSHSEIHMKLAKLGYMSKLVDFLRVNDDNELLEITGLTITRLMISSDRRICQLFNRHGGTSLLMALLQKDPTSELKRAVCSTLNTANNVMHSSPDTGQVDPNTAPPADVWEHIMQRWSGEDEVVSVLKQFL